MADYYPLIAKAVAGLDKSTGEARRALYDRARSALVAQLRGVTPALNESDITRERLALEEAIRKVETEAARRSRTDPPPRPVPPAPPPGRAVHQDMPQPPPSVEAVEMRPAPSQISPPQIRVSPAAASVVSEPVQAAEEHADIGVEPSRDIPARPERPRWSPGANPSLSDRGLKGFRDVVEGETLAGATAPAGNGRAASGVAVAPSPPPVVAESAPAEPRIEADPPRPARRLPPAERGLARPPAPDPVRAREAREPRRSRDPVSPRPSSRRLEPPPPPPFLDAPGDPIGPSPPEPDLNDFEVKSEPPTRPPSSIVRQEDVRRPTPPRAPQPEKRREKRAEKRPEKRAEPRPEKRDDKRVDRWAEKPPEKKKSGFAALPLGKIAIWTVVGLAVIALVGFLVWKPPTGLLSLFAGAPGQPRPVETRVNGTQPKIADRIGGSASPSAEDGTMVAQKVVLYEEDPEHPEGKRFVGSVVWRTEAVPPAPGQPPDVAVRADIEIPEQKLSARWSLRRNNDKALPASHTVEVMFTLPPDFAHGGITNIPGVLMKQNESTRGVPLAGLAVKVTNGFFLIGLSAVDTDVQRNLQLLKDKPWFDIPVVYNNGGRAILAMEKGPPGDRAFADAFAAWSK